MIDSGFLWYKKNLFCQVHFLFTWDGLLCQHVTRRCFLLYKCSLWTSFYMAFYWFAIVSLFLSYSVASYCTLGLSGILDFFLRIFVAMVCLNCVVSYSKTRHFAVGNTYVLVDYFGSKFGGKISLSLTFSCSNFTWGFSKDLNLKFELKSNWNWKFFYPKTGHDINYSIKSRCINRLDLDNTVMVKTRICTEPGMNNCWTKFLDYSKWRISLLRIQYYDAK